MKGWFIFTFLSASYVIVMGDITFHEPGNPGGQPSGPGAPRVTAPRRKFKHDKFHVNVNEERRHIQSHVKEDYLDMDKLDDKALLMQYFRKHDTDNNWRLDGIELLKALAGMEKDHSHDDDDHHDEVDSQQPDPQMDINLEEFLPLVDQILASDDKNNDGYITWTEFIQRQKQN